MRRPREASVKSLAAFAQVLAMMGAKPANVQRLGDAFVAGVFWGAAIIGISNGLWGGCNWGGGNVNVNKFNNPDEGWKLSTP